MWIICKIAGENAVTQDYKLRLESLLEWPFPIWNESIVSLGKFGLKTKKKILYKVQMCILIKIFILLNVEIHNYNELDLLN